jgi:hypothetical protein
MHLGAIHGGYTYMYYNSGAGSWASARFRAASRPAAVLLSALPGRSRQSSASPPAPLPDPAILALSVSKRRVSSRPPEPPRVSGGSVS